MRFAVDILVVMEHRIGLMLGILVVLLDTCPMCYNLERLSALVRALHPQMCYDLELGTRVRK